MLEDFVSPKVELFRIGNDNNNIQQQELNHHPQVVNHDRNDEIKSNDNNSPSSKQGRIIRAREDINEGEILVIEKAYASVLHQSNINFNSHTFCVVCQKKKRIMTSSSSGTNNTSSSSPHNNDNNNNNESSWMLCGDESCEYLKRVVYRENELMMIMDQRQQSTTMYDYLLRMAEECGIEFSLLLLVYRICRKFEFDSNNNNNHSDEENVLLTKQVIVDRKKMDNLMSLETHRDDIYPEHLFLFRKASSCLKERIFVESEIISEDLIIDTFCRIFVNAHSITHTRWWWHHQYSPNAEIGDSSSIVGDVSITTTTIEDELEEISQFFKGDYQNESLILDSPFFIPLCSSDREDHTENSCADFRDIGTGLFPMVSMFDHSCSPNCSFQTFDDMKKLRNDHSTNGSGGSSGSSSSSGNIILVQTVKKVKKGEELCISYIDIMNPTCIRRRELWYSKYFVCKCSRCTSETEENRMVRAYLCNDCNRHNDEQQHCSNTKNNNGYLVPIYHCNVSEEPKKDLSASNMNNDLAMMVNSKCTDESPPPPFNYENDFNIEDFDEEEYDKALSMFEDIYENGGGAGTGHHDGSSYGREPGYYDQREIDEDYIQRISHWKCTQCENIIQGNGAAESELFQNMERHLSQELISMGQQVSEDNLKMNDLPNGEYCKVLLNIVHTLWQSIEKVESGCYPGFESVKVHPNHYLLFQFKGKFISMLIKLFEKDPRWWTSENNDGGGNHFLQLGLTYLSEMANCTKQIFPTFHTEIMLFHCKLLKYKKWMLEHGMMQAEQTTSSTSEQQLLLANLLEQYRVIIK